MLGASLPAAAEEKTTSTAVFGGIDLGPNAQTVYLGSIVALNGDFARSGFVLRGLGVYSTYDYRAAVGEVDGRLSQVDVMLGYHFLTPYGRALAYVGVEHQDHRLSPFDPTNPVFGGETGLKVAADITPYVGHEWYVNLMASYSTAFDSYWARLRVGHNFGNVTIGPEGQTGGNEVYEEYRIGLFMDFRFDEPWVRATISAGHHFSDRQGIFGGRDGGYAALNIGVGF